LGRAGGREWIVTQPLSDTEFSYPLPKPAFSRSELPATTAAAAITTTAAAATAAAAALASGAGFINGEGATVDFFAVHGGDSIGRLIFRDVNEAESFVRDYPDFGSIVRGE
jgi:hypothetical protein